MQANLVTPLSDGYLGSDPDIFRREYNWACTTCGHCIIECPAFINPVDQVIQLRRYQVLTTGKCPAPWERPDAIWNARAIPGGSHPRNAANGLKVPICP